jgi:hypothetical protein
MPKDNSATNPAHLSIRGVKVKSIKRAGNEDVYCLSVNKNRTMVANGIITGNCDALRYALFTAFGKRYTLDVLKAPEPVGKNYEDIRNYGFR